MAEHTVIEPAYVSTLVSALTNELAGATIETERVMNDRYRFIVLWAHFDDVGHSDRQSRVWNIAEKSLAPADLLKVGMIITMSPGDLTAG
jgi:hypothetical protein